ncbi:MAG: DUF3142 domain-containing protein, partial [Planctomycetes bacterium]|nr:DUF3142 domain-containing protein [Planctomycetota bacterium]
MPPPPPLLALLLAPLLAAAEAPDPARAWAVWHWGGAASLEPAQVQALRTAGCDRVWRWVALIEAGPRRSRRGGALAGADELPWEACVRVDAACTPLLERDGGASLWPLITAEPGAAGLQIDWDVPVRLLPQYAGWLSGLRHRLPPGTPLACTALLSWLDAPGFAAVAAAV